MGLKQEDRQIGDHVYRVRQLPYKQGRALIPVLLRALGPSFAALLEGGLAAAREGQDKLLELDFDLRSAVAEFTASLSEQDLTRLTDELATRSWIVDPPEGYPTESDTSEAGCTHLPRVEEEHWPPRYHEWLSWLAFAVEVNFGSFFGGKLNVQTALSGLQRAASPSRSPKNSTGRSGGS
ncbi:MAG: hypothetical protein GWN84_20525 [Gammaproteobacteria bacterium]|nr:hypothetical protein [Gammaproteobacteria bacterium]NIR85147.1 hypothetical protein [Gammaproteobacteria bacterium]NIU06196.1 hypothetical protein [Gammaproteobacteria bacterium]NIX87469.1 hypothetical protein [Gammaproteobacteria bacterium]